MTKQKDNPVNVLLVDDDSALLQVAELVLKDMDRNIHVETAQSAQEATQKLAVHPIDVIVSDYEMPQTSGLDFLKALREKNNKTPFILFTGKGREEIAIQALNLGADRYLNKVGNPETVYKELTISINQLNVRAKAQQMLRESEERLRIFIENAPDAIFTSDLDGKYLDGNKQAEQLHGYPREEIVGKNLFEIGIISQAAPEIKKMTDALREGRKVGPIEVSLKRKNGDTIVIEVSVFPVKKNDRVEVLGIARDVTQRKNAEVELEHKYETLDRVAQSLDSALAIIGKDYRVVWANSVLKRRLTDKDKKCYQIFNNLNSTCPDCGVKKVFEENAAVDTHEYSFIGFNGKPRWVELRVTPLKDQNGTVIGAIELGVPITERKKAEQELRESEERYAKLSAATFEGIVIHRDGVILDANPQFAKIYQYSLSEIIGKDGYTLIDPPQRGRSRDNIFLGLEGPYETLGLRKDGSTFPVEIRSKQISYKGSPARVSAVLDITERKKHEEQVRILSSLFELASDAIFVCDAEGKILYFNEATYKPAGYTREEMAAMTLYTYCSPAAAELVKSRIEMILAKGTAVFESEHMRKDKSVFPCEVNARIIESSGAKLILNVARDIADRKKAEAKLATMNEKLQVVGKLTRHDVRNKLSTVSSTTYLLKKRYGSDPEVSRYLQNIDSAVTMSNRLFDLTSLYEKIGAQQQTLVDVKACFDEAATLFPNKGNIEIVNEAQGLVVVADSLLRQVFYNLIDNSLKHGKTATKIRLHYTVEGNLTKLYYEDNGVGVPQENKQKIFVEHFSTNGGTGLGLSVIKKMMAVYDWTIKEVGVPGEGAKFEISIPAQATA